MAFDIARGIFCSINYTLLWSIISFSLISKTYSGPCRFAVFDFVITTPLKLPVHVYGAFTEIRGKGRNISHTLNATLWHACKNLFMMSHSKKISAFSVFKGKKVIACIQFQRHHRMHRLLEVFNILCPWTATLHQPWNGDRQIPKSFCNHW